MCVYVRSCPSFANAETRQQTIYNRTAATRKLVGNSVLCKNLRAPRALKLQRSFKHSNKNRRIQQNLQTYRYLTAGQSNPGSQLHLSREVSLKSHAKCQLLVSRSTNTCYQLIAMRTGLILCQPPWRIHPFILPECHWILRSFGQGYFSVDTRFSSGQKSSQQYIIWLGLPVV